MKFKTIFAGLVFLAGLAAISGPAQASLVSVSDLISGNDSVIGVSDALGVNVTLVDKSDDDTSGSSPLLMTVTNTLENDEIPPEGLEGTWTTNPPTNIDVIVIKAGNNYVILSYLGMPVTGGNWCTNACTIEGMTLPDLAAGLSHISAYSVVPIPASLPLFLTALAGLVLIARRRTQRT